MNQHILSHYQQAASQAAAEAANFKKKADTYSLMRLAVFALLIAGICVGIMGNSFTLIALVTILCLAIFAWLVSQQSGFERERDYYLGLSKVNQNEIASISHKGNLYSNGVQFQDEKHFYTSDLDIFGNASLFQLMNRAATVPGNRKLAAWLSSPADKETILLRQEAVKELSVKKNWKAEMQTLLLFANTADANELSRLITYLNNPVDIPGEKWLKKYFNIAPFIMAAAVTLAFFVGEFKIVALLIGVLHGQFVLSRQKHVRKAELIVGKIGATLAAYARTFKKAEDEQWQSAYCQNISVQLKEKQTSAQIKELSRLVNNFNARLNMLVGTVLNLFFLWDLKQIIAIEDWKRSNRQNLEDAFEVIAGLEALISIAGLHINYPEWTIPHIADGDGYTFTATQIAHPLISAEKRVANSYQLIDTHKIDIITGSNMAGKSTFLRTIGINTVLALSGAPVCAKAMEVSVINIISYMRIKDSLNESTSTFKAELDRLQMLLGAVETVPKVFFLIDEMLRGTNSVDKYLGSKAVIEQLIAKNAVGMVATHDLQIAQLEKKYPGYVRNYYFDIQVIDGEMLFDYKLKHGECKTFNASLLLKRIGIEVGSE
ncbi:DNA mismatch repair protein MutS [Mucilaginibacter limnophilus]|uniref:DNA mismatch repair protein MutS n=1 Tax=Mucilaginibacter limnophilus TaxID=1932778 RepID=A0A437MRH3_9SPHI|nr:DNA mismatch repair protein MutS [Mucilaginibacter limnophilus]RVU00250.1 DNA mismatch repair protein MutS [Mucilaginibacter limnophilus]